MPTLNWIGKQAVEKHHLEIPYRLLEYDESLSSGDQESGNLLIQGDNLHALKALLPYYAGKVKCIYIDPPYNTGKENWIYNDNVKAPEIVRWLDQLVGDEENDFTRHDKWLCMMYPRLQLLHKLMSKDGLIFISIDDNELQFLKIIMDEIFGRQNFVTNFIWRTDGNFDNQAKVKINHEYILCYAKRIELFEHPNVIDPNVSQNSKLYKDQIINTIVKNGPKNPVSSILLPKNFPASFKDGTIPQRNDSWPHYNSNAVIKDYKLQNEVIVSSGWSSKKIFEDFITNKFVPVKDTKGQVTRFVISSTGAIENIKDRVTQSHVISSLYNLGNTQAMSSELKKLDISFSYPKPVTLIEYLLSLINSNDHIVLDSFAGSGTTAHAVMNLNSKDNGLRKYILVELENDIVVKVTKQRISKIITSNNDLKSGFRYCKLSDPLFDKYGNVRAGVKFKELARHIFFSETGSPLSEKAKLNTPKIGTYRSNAYYLLFNGILGDKSVNGGNVLTSTVLDSLPKHSGLKIIFGEANRLGLDRLKKENVIFKQIPYEIKTS